MGEVRGYGRGDIGERIWARRGDMAGGHMGEDKRARTYGQGDRGEVLYTCNGQGQGQPMGKDNEHGARVMGKGKDIG